MRLILLGLFFSLLSSSYSKDYDEDVKKFYNNPIHVVAIAYKRSKSENKLTRHLASLDELKDYYSHCLEFISFKDTSASRFTAIFEDKFIKLKYELVCEDRHDSLFTFWQNMTFIGKAFNPNITSYTNDFYFERIDNQISFKLAAPYYLVNSQEIEELVKLLPEAYENGKYVRCVDQDTTVCMFILDDVNKLCPSCVEVEDLTKTQIDHFLKSIININTLDPTVLTCEFFPHDGLLLYAHGKPIYKMELCFHCDEVLFKNLITGKSNYYRFRSTNVCKDPLWAKIIKRHNGSTKEKIEYHKLKIKELEYELK